MYQNQLSCQNSAIVQDPGYRWQYFPPWCSKERNFVPLQQGLHFTHEIAAMIKLYFKNFSPRICANLFPWNTRRRQLTTASQPIGKLINHVQNLSFYFFDHVQNLSFYFFQSCSEFEFLFWVPISYSTSCFGAHCSRWSKFQWAPLSNFTFPNPVKISPFHCFTLSLHKHFVTATFFDVSISHFIDWMTWVPFDIEY